MPDIEGAVTHKVGGVPVWVWAAVAVGGGVVVYYVFLRPSSGSSQATFGTSLGTGSGGSMGGGGGGGDSGGTPVVPATEKPPSNADWLQRAVNSVVQQTGMSAAQVSLYLTEYLNGRQPVGNMTAYNDYSRVIQAALQGVGRPPVEGPVSNPNNNPFLSNADYLANLLGFLPSGTSGGVRQELINLFNGSTNTLSQAAASTLAAMEAILGVAPTIPGFSINVPQPATPAPAPPPSPTPAPTPPASGPDFLPGTPIVDPAPVVKSFGEAVIEIAGWGQNRIRRISATGPDGNFYVDVASTSNWTPFTTGIVNPQNQIIVNGVVVGVINEVNRAALMLNNWPPEPGWTPGFGEAISSLIGRGTTRLRRIGMPNDQGVIPIDFADTTNWSVWGKGYVDAQNRVFSNGQQVGTINPQNRTALLASNPPGK